MVMRKFPKLKKFSFTSTKKQKWNTRIQMSGSGKTRSMTNQLYPQWIISAKLLHLTREEANELMGFVALLKGNYEPFLWLDPEDFEEKGVQLPMIAPGIYQAVMRIGKYTEPVDYIENVTVYIDGTKQSSGYSVTNGTIKFSTPPSANSKVAADYTYYWKVRFSQDEMEIQNIFVNLNDSKTFKMVSAR